MAQRHFQARGRSPAGLHVTHRITSGLKQPSEILLKLWIRMLSSYFLMILKRLLSLISLQFEQCDLNFHSPFFPTITSVLKDFKERKQFAIMKISSSTPSLYRNIHKKAYGEHREHLLPEITILPESETELKLLPLPLKIWQHIYHLPTCDHSYLRVTANHGQIRKDGHLMSNVQGIFKISADQLYVH